MVFQEEALKREQLPLGTRRLLMEAVSSRGEPSPARAPRAPGAGRAAASPNASPGEAHVHSFSIVRVCTGQGDLWQPLLLVGGDANHQPHAVYYLDCFRRAIYLAE